MCLQKLFSATGVALRQVNSMARASPQKLKPILREPARQFGDLIPGDQYDNNRIPRKLKLGYAMCNHWEIIPLLICVAVDMFVLAGAVYVAFNDKVDTQLTGHNWNCISRNMDLRNPTIHKILVFYQRYEPWTQMQNVLDKMKAEERKQMVKADACPMESLATADLEV